MNVNGLSGSYSNASPNVSYAKVSGLGQSGSTDATKTGNSTTATSNNSVVVNISDSAKAASAQATEQPSFKDVGMAARAKLDALKQQAADKTGTTVSSVNVQQAGLIDYSSFSDQELAAMDLNSSGNFSQTERDAAGGMLGERMRVSLETYRGATNLGDRRGHAMTIDALYKQMTPEVRSALGWTPTMMAANDHMLAGDEEKFGKLLMSGILANLQATQGQGGLTFSG
ncbi:MAG: hypothetical protein ACTS5I_08130 [Rhodanobacter sp.]